MYVKSPYLPCTTVVVPEINPFTFLFSRHLLFFSPLRDMLLLFVWCCLEPHPLYPRPLLCYF